jgi:hypothetical protein
LLRVSEEHITSIFRNEEYAKRETIDCRRQADLMLGLLLDPEIHGFSSQKIVGLLFTVTTARARGPT